jgi:hypothetical protein
MKQERATEMTPKEIATEIKNSRWAYLGRKLREDLTPEEKERLEKYGSIEFKSAGATRKR